MSEHVVKVHRGEIFTIDPKKQYILTVSIDNTLTQYESVVIKKRVTEEYAKYGNVKVLVYREGVKVHIEEFAL